MRKVITLDSEGLEAACLKLESMCDKPAVVVGIATGGAVVASKMFAGVPHIEVALRRSGTKAKRCGCVRGLFRLLPVKILDFMRVAESRMLASRKQSEKHFSLTDGEISALAGAGSVLIVDDAVDSGATLQAVKTAVEAAVSAGCAVRTAVLTVTTQNPLIQPDAWLWRELVRYPWSADFKAK